MRDFSNLPDIEDEYDELDELEDLIDDIKLTYNRNKSRHPICKGKMQAFEHIITRENKYKTKRDYDPGRANKIYWIRPIIYNRSDPRIKYFERLNDKGYNQQYYWYEEKGFIVLQWLQHKIRE